MDLTQLIKQLRDETGVSIMECKKALEKAEMDLDKARIILKEEGLARADKKAERETKAGIISTFVTADNKIASIVEFRCETDFVAKNEEFINLANTIAKEVALQNPSTIEEFLQKTITDGSETIDSAIRSLVAKIGEKMEITRFKRIETEGYVGSYIHAGSRLAVLLNVKADKAI
jgi:elongation factor Ts